MRSPGDDGPPATIAGSCIGSIPGVVIRYGDLVRAELRVKQRTK